jgi:hypothetical protein
MGSQPVIKIWPNGDEVAYIHFRNGQNGSTDFRWDSNLGEMALDPSTIPNLPAGQLRFVKTQVHHGQGNGYDDITDEQTTLTMAGNSIFNSHWSATTTHYLDSTNRNSDSAGLSYTNGISTTKERPIIRSLFDCTFSSTHLTTSACTNLHYTTDGAGGGNGRYYNGPAFYVYHKIADPPGWKPDSTILNTGSGSAYSAGFLPRYSFVAGNLLVVEGNGGDVSVFSTNGSSTPVSTPTPTKTPTPAATSTSTPITTPTITGTQSANQITTIRLGTGGTDVTPRNIVRTPNNLFIFANQQYSPLVRGYWTTSANLPNTSSDFSASISVDNGSNVIQVDSIFNGNDYIYVVVNDQQSRLRVFPFEISTKTFKSPTTLVMGNPIVSGDYVGSGGISGLVSTTGDLQLAYWSNGNHIIHASYNYNSASNLFTEISNFQVDSQGNSNHPHLVISPQDNSTTV